MLFCGTGAQALQVFAVAFMRLHDSGALRDEAVLFGRLRGIASPNILPLLICESRHVQILKYRKLKGVMYFLIMSLVILLELFFCSSHQLTVFLRKPWFSGFPIRGIASPSSFPC